MRLLVLSNVSGSVDKIVDVLHKNHNVVAKESNASVATMASMAAEQLAKGACDQVIMVARDPMAAGVLLNKQEGVVAVVCNSTDDVRLAKDNGANVIVIRNIDADELHEIVVQATGTGGVMGSIKVPQIKMPAVKMPDIMPKQQSREEMPAQEPKRQKIVFAKKPKQEVQREDDVRTPNDGTIVGKIKDYLGII